MAGIFPLRFRPNATGEINTHIPYYIILKTVQTLNNNSKSIKRAKVPILGMAYKKNVDAPCESLSLKFHS